MILSLNVPLLFVAGLMMMLGVNIVGAQENYRLSCKPPLKFMAGACVAACYAGYEDQGRWCELRRGGGSGGG